MEKRTCVEILWTGGYDSTFRIVQLSRLDIDIQPYYVSDNRNSEQNELQAIADITEALKAHPSTKCTFLPLSLVDITERVEDALISETYQKVLKTDFFGSQYEWLARFAKYHRGIELSVHQDDKAIQLINKYGVLMKVQDPVLGENYILDIENSSEEMAILFGDYRFPIVNYTKVDMKQFYIENGYRDVMNMTWFCYSPIKGKPCGKCNPCRYTILEGMGERFTATAKVRYRISTFRLNHPGFMGFLRKIKNSIRKTSVMN